VHEEASEGGRMEARVGIEPTNRGFADLCLTTWLPRLKACLHTITPMAAQSRKWWLERTFPFVFSLCGVTGLLLSSCAASPAGPLASIRKSAHSISVASIVPDFVSRPIPLMGTPKDVKLDYVYPMTFMRQKLVWADAEGQWLMTFPSRRYAYAGIFLRKPVDLAAEREFTRLAFRMRPARLAPFLSVALLDQSSNLGDRAMTDFWLNEYGPFNGDGWVTVEIALTNFPSQATTLVEGALNPLELTDPPRRDFNWSNIHEVRFVSGGGRIPSQEIVVTNLRFLR
jgi:hypothetical protein